MIIVPTRELAIQIDQQIEGFGYFLGIHSLPVYGGGVGRAGISKESVDSRVDIIVATPDKLISYLNLGHVKLDHIRYLILDEADRNDGHGF